MADHDRNSKIITPNWANKRLTKDERVLMRQYDVASALNADIRGEASCPDAIQVPPPAQVKKLNHRLSESSIRNRKTPPPKK